MGTSRSNISYVQNKKIDRLTLNQLFNYLGRLVPDFRFMISIDSTLSAGRPTLMTGQTLPKSKRAKALNRRDRDDVGQDVHHD